LAKTLGLVPRCPDGIKWKLVIRAFELLQGEHIHGLLIQPIQDLRQTNG
jgi:hypothetical protein